MTPLTLFSLVETIHTLSPGVEFSIRYESLEDVNVDGTISPLDFEGDITRGSRPGCLGS